MATITKTPEECGYNNYTSGFRGWYTDANTRTLQIYNFSTSWQYALYKAKTAFNPSQVTAVSFDVTFTPRSTYQDDATFVCSIYAGDPRNDEPVATAQFSLTDNTDIESTTHRFSFQGIGFEANDIIGVRIEKTNQTSGIWELTAPQISLTYTLPALGLSVSPATVYDISSSLSGFPNTVRLDFSNRGDQALTGTLAYNSTVLRTFTVEPAGDDIIVEDETANNDFVLINCSGLFALSGATGNSIRVNVNISDGIGRTASGYFTLIKPQGGAISPVAPRSTTVNGNETISFSWAYSGDGTLTKTELQWSTDNATWSDLATISGNGTTWTAAAYKFPKGTIYWRARATNSFGLAGNWSSGVSFTVSFPTLSVGVTPPSLYAGSRITASFSNRLSRTLTVQFFYNSTLLYTTTAASDSASILCEEAWFTTAGVSGNSMSVKIRASDDLGRVSSDVSFTVLRPVGGTISPVAPRSTTLDGTASINFAWSYSGDGTLTKSELQWSRDNAAWTDLTTVSGNGTAWTAAPISFPAGTIYWRARATNSFGLVGAWSSGVSFTARYAAQSQAVPVNSPISGTIIAAQAQTFQVALEASAPVYEPFSVDSATFFWRAGEAGNYTSAAMTPNSNSASITIPAGTFPSGNIQWYASATDNTGRTTQTDVFTLSTLNAAVEAVPLAPNNTVESNTGDIIFSWDFLSLDGGASAGAQLQKSADGTSWSDLASVPAGLNSIAVPGSGFAAGRVFWRVRAENASGVWSEWSAALSFQVLGAPIIASITGDGKPFLTVNWQVEGQLAYKIEVDGRQYGPYRGESTRSFTLPEPLPDGLHVVKVAAQNQYGLWSAWAEANVSVANVPGAEITVAEGTGSPDIGVNYFNATPPPEIVKTLPERVVQDNGSFGLVCQTASRLVSYQWQQQAPNATTWTDISGATSAIRSFPANSASNGYKYRCKAYNALGEVYTNVTTFTYGSPAYMSDTYDTDLYPETGHFLIYRDGVLIGKTRRNYFTDRTALEAHEYYVLQVLPGGYYTKSNVVTLTGYVDCPAIALLSGGEFLMLELSEDANRTQTITKTGEVAYIQYSGAKHPEAEVGEAESLTVTGDGSFTAEQEAEARRFEAMLKKAVIYKTPGGEVVVGILQGFTRRDPRFFKSYSFSVTQIERRDFVNA